LSLEAKRLITIEEINAEAKKVTSALNTAGISPAFATYMALLSVAVTAMRDSGMMRSRIDELYASLSNDLDHVRQAKH
jgi:hypothetical protein